MGKNAPGASFCSQCKKRTGSLIVYKNRELCRECDQAMSLEEKLAESTPAEPDPEEAVETPQDAPGTPNPAQDQRTAPVEPPRPGCGAGSSQGHIRSGREDPEI